MYDIIQHCRPTTFSTYVYFNPCYRKCCERVKLSAHSNLVFPFLLLFTHQFSLSFSFQEKKRSYLILEKEKFGVSVEFSMSLSKTIWGVAVPAELAGNKTF